MQLSSTSCTVQSVTVGNASPCWTLDMPCWLGCTDWLFWPLLWELWLPPLQFLTTSCPTKMPWSFGLRWHSATQRCCSTLKVILRKFLYLVCPSATKYTRDSINYVKSGIQSSQTMNTKYTFMFVCFYRGAKSTNRSGGSRTLRRIKTGSFTGPRADGGWVARRPPRPHRSPGWGSLPPALSGPAAKCPEGLYIYSETVKGEASRFTSLNFRNHSCSVVYKCWYGRWKRWPVPINQSIFIFRKKRMKF